MGLFDFLNNPSDTNQTPGAQGLLALSQALLQAGAPSRIPVSNARAFGAAIPAGLDAYQNARQRLALSQMLQTSGAPPALASMVNSNDPQLRQTAGTVLAEQMKPQVLPAGSTLYQNNQPVASNSIFGTPPGGNTPGAPQPESLTGDDFLKTLNPQVAGTVKSIAEGRMAISPMMARTPQGIQLLGAVAQYDPTFDATNYNARSKVLADTTSGKTSQNIKSIETALNTLAQAQDASDKLGGTSGWGILNAPINSAHAAIMGLENDPALNTYTNYAKNAADETTRAVIGAGGTGADRETRMETFRASQSPEARKASFQAAANELASRLDPIANMYNQAFSTDKKSNIDFLSPTAQANFRKLTGQAAANATAGSPNAAPNAAPNAPKSMLPPAGAIAMLKANPSLAPQFEAKYGIPAASFLGRASGN